MPVEVGRYADVRRVNILIPYNIYYLGLISVHAGSVITLRKIRAFGGCLGVERR